VTHDGELDLTVVAAVLSTDWGFTSSSVTPHDGGMNSQTWFVQAGDARYVAKAVPVDRRDSFEAGLAAATIVEAAGITAGAPIPSLAGGTSVEVDGHALALLRYVDGSELTGDSIEDCVLIGSTLGRVHRALVGHDLPGAGRFPWLDPASPHLSVRPWVRPAIEAALSAWRAIPPESLTWAPLHTDPAPEAFRFEHATRTCGLIDWDLGVVGPLLYDLASAEMYVGGPRNSGPLIAAYLATGALAQEEIERGLRPLVGLRWAVQADYFAMRIATDDLTGILDASENETGLEDARRAILG
jgi:Ser/Thr protein kinase RdoA (MazF antagonist)